MDYCAVLYRNLGLELGSTVTLGYTHENEDCCPCDAYSESRRHLGVGAYAGSGFRRSGAGPETTRHAAPTGLRR